MNEGGGASGRAPALFFFVLPVLLVAAAVVLRSARSAGVVGRLRPLVDQAIAIADAEGVPPALLLAVASAESGGRTNVSSHKGAVGVMQLLEGTANDMARRGGEPTPDRTDPEASLRLGARYLGLQLRRFEGRPHRVALALCAYNAGPARVSDWLQKSVPDSAPGGIYDWVPFPETRAYVRRVTEWERRWGALLAQRAAD